MSAVRVRLPPAKDLCMKDLLNCGIFTVKQNQSTKSIWWRPRDLEPMKGVTTDDMPRGAGRML